MRRLWLCTCVGTICCGSLLSSTPASLEDQGRERRSRRQQLFSLDLHVAGGESVFWRGRPPRICLVSCPDREPTFCLVARGELGRGSPTPSFRRDCPSGAGVRDADRRSTAVVTRERPGS